MKFKLKQNIGMSGKRGKIFGMSGDIAVVNTAIKVI